MSALNPQAYIIDYTIIDTEYTLCKEYWLILATFSACALYLNSV